MEALIGLPILVILGFFDDIPAELLGNITSSIAESLEQT